MKKIINEKEKIISQMLRGLQKANEDKVEINEELKIVYRKNLPIKGKVGLISGGGSGHEPAHAGYVGDGMLDCAICGEIFTSPTPDQVLEAIKLADSGEGVFMVVKNYTGDVLNFETAAELCEMDDIEVRTVIINDDVAVEDSLYTAGRRGVAGTMLVEKIAGAAAERGDNLDEVTRIANEVNDNMRSMGLALGPCTVPHAGKPSFDLGDTEVEMGIGIHGEPGYRRTEMKTADELTAELYEKVRADLPFVQGDRVIVLVNGMGATPLSELYIVNRKVHELLKADGIVAERTLVGDYVTSLDMPGASLTLLRVNDEMLELFDAPALTAGYREGM